MMKQVIRALIGIVLLLAVAPLTANAAAPPSIIIDGKAFAAPKGEPAPYINKDGRTMIPIRFFAAALGVPNDEDHIAWDAENRTAAIVSGDKAVYITVEKREIIVNGDFVVMDTVAEIKNGRVFIPARYLAEALGCNVQWDNEGRRVLIYTPKYLENHKAMKSGFKSDIDDPWITEAFWAKWKNKIGVSEYGSAEVLRQRITDVRKLAAKIKIERDDKNQRFTVTIPEYDDKKFHVTLGSPALGTPFEPGTYHVYFKDANPRNGYVFGLSISDRQTGAYILYDLAVFNVNGEYKFFYGSDIDKHRESMGL
jgi:hypothetical protein